MNDGTNEKWEDSDSRELLGPAAGDVREGSAEFPAALLSDGRSQHLAGSCMHLSTTDYLKEADAETDPFF